MDKNRLWLIGGVMLIGAIVVLGWGLGISPKLNEASATGAEWETTIAENAVHEAQIVTLKKQFEQVAGLRADLSDIQQSVPGSAEMPALVAEFDSAAASSGVVIADFTTSDAQAFDPALLNVVAPAGGVSPVPTTAGDGADVVGATAVVAVDPRITATNFVTIPLSVTVDGPSDSVLDFVSGIQNGRRLVTVTAVSTTVPDEVGAVTGTITALVYVLLDPNAMVPAVQ